MQAAGQTPTSTRYVGVIEGIKDDHSQRKAVGQTPMAKGVGHVLDTSKKTATNPRTGHVCDALGKSVTNSITLQLQQKLL